MYLGKLQQEVGKQVTITDVFNIIHSHGFFSGIDQVFSNSAPRDLVVVLMKVEYLYNRYNPRRHLSGCLLPRASFCIPRYLPLRIVLVDRYLMR